MSLKQSFPHISQILLKYYLLVHQIVIFVSYLLVVIVIVAILLLIYAVWRCFLQMSALQYHRLKKQTEINLDLV
jgi:hypothetical protein